MFEQFPSVLSVLAFAVLFSLAFLVLILFRKNWKNHEKKILFWSFTIVIALVTFYFLLYTLLMNVTSETKGPVHWHADFEIWVCGQEQELPKSKGISGKVGTALLHTHNDYRIHIEGTVMDKEEVSLGNFFDSIGGVLAETYIGIPQEDGSIVYWHNGDVCPDGHSGTLTMYVKKGESMTVVADSANYVPSPETNVPPGDQITITFD